MKITYEQITDDVKVDTLTGEVIEQETTTEIKSITNKKIPNEPEYTKFYKYVNTLFAFKGIKQTLTPFIIEISNHMTYAKEGQIVSLNKITKAKIADNMNVSTKRLDQVIAELKANDILRKIQNGVYSVNPYIVARGNWADIRKLQMQYDFMTDEMTAVADVKDKITGKEIRKAISNKKGQIPGQISLFDLPEMEDKKPQQKAIGSNKFNNFQQSEVNYSDLEDELLDN